METLYNIEVKDRESFIRFLKLLYQDFLKNQKEWENSSLEDFLDALAAYTEDTRGYYCNNKNQKIDADIPSWKLFADILRGAIVYE